MLRGQHTTSCTWNEKKHTAEEPHRHAAVFVLCMLCCPRPHWPRSLPCSTTCRRLQASMKPQLPAPLLPEITINAITQPQTFYAPSNGNVTWNSCQGHYSQTATGKLPKFFQRSLRAYRAASRAVTARDSMPEVCRNVVHMCSMPVVPCLQPWKYWPLLRHRFHQPSVAVPVPDGEQ